MAHSGGTITAPVGLLSDIYPVMGLSTSNASLVYVCSNSHGKINKWSKVKPVEISNTPFIHIKTDTLGTPHPFTGTYINVPAWLGRMYTETVRPGGSTADEILLAHIAGIGVPMLSNTTMGQESERENTALRVKRVVDNLNAWGVNWEYIAPVPPTYPARQTDFDGYDHNAACPIEYWCSPKIYNGEMPAFSCTLVPEHSTSIDVSEFAGFFPNYKIYGAIFKGGSYREIAFIENLSAGTGEVGQGKPIYTLSGANAGQYSVYFFASDGNRSLIFPTLANQSNPQQFRAEQQNNPATDPFAGSLDFDIQSPGCGFAHTHSAPYFESIENVQEGDYVTLCTTAYYCLKVLVRNNTSSLQTFRPSKFTSHWDESGRDLAVQVYSANGDVAPSTVNVAANSSVHIFIEWVDVFLGMPPSTNTEYGTIDYMHLYYDGAEVVPFLCDVTYDPSHNGYFKKGNTYYKTR